jgi:hypothetical protein
LADPASRIKNRTVEEIIALWNKDLEDHIAAFTEQASSATLLILQLLPALEAARWCFAASSTGVGGAEVGSAAHRERQQGSELLPRFWRQRPDLRLPSLVVLSQIIGLQKNVQSCQLAQVKLNRVLQTIKVLCGSHCNSAAFCCLGSFLSWCGFARVQINQQDLLSMVDQLEKGTSSS